jgi:hypothetical protein
MCGDYNAAEDALRAIERVGQMTVEEMKAAADKLTAYMLWWGSEWHR